MPTPPKDKPIAREHVSLVVALGLAGIAIGGVLSVFWAPLAAWVGAR